MTSAIDYALLIGEMEGVHAKLRDLGTLDEIEYIENLKKKYYKQYFAKLKEEREDAWHSYIMGVLRRSFFVGNDNETISRYGRCRCDQRLFHLRSSGWGDNKSNSYYEEWS